MNESFDHIVLLAAGIKEGLSGRWVSTDLSAEDHASSAPGGKLRIEAVAILAQKNPVAKVLTGGNTGFDVPSGPPDRPLLADILFSELTEFGVSPERIILEHKSNTTYQSLTQLQEREKVLGLNKIAIVSNRYHLPRLEALLKIQFQQFLENVEVQLVAAEDILIEHDEVRWKKFVEKSYSSEFMQQRIRMEDQGLKDLLSGKYKFR